MKKQLGFIALVMISAVAAQAFAAETKFPSKTRTLTAIVPPECTEWTPPLPDKQVGAEYPDELKGERGTAGLLVRISADGQFVGVVDSLATNDAFTRAAEESVKQWTFKAAKCNGRHVTADARVDFNFRSEGAISYKSGNFFSR
jgi:outer membrane biosynthesis protein TonB